MRRVVGWGSRELFLVAVVGQFASIWYRYTASMAVHDAERSAGIHTRQTSNPTHDRGAA